MRKTFKLFLILLSAIFLFTGCLTLTDNIDIYTDTAFEVFEKPEFSETPYTVINNNIPYFNTEFTDIEAYEEYAPLDKYGRCTAATALIGKELMPTEERGSIGQVKPTGWHTSKYDFVDGKYLYNRCHLIGYQLTGENANERNLITGTRYLNTKGMLPFENMVADYIKETDNHVLYRVTPYYTKENLLADGVLMEAYSVEDKGKGICFNVFCHNVQPGVIIDYATGQNDLDNSVFMKTDDEEEENFILNISSKKIHKPACSSINNMKEKNKRKFTGYLSTLLNEGYKKCGECF